ncbi:hypothetical protein SAMN05443572_109284 [Myxococcus fulvus]|uniref:Lipoprotein n=1 Tax=Myxococcus fulvus TaxID=33 RepID=A0ABY1CR49_MYXFU|nr:hypothetical protein SAMN05443572_109284 [Myxococcus fulvus]
MLHVCRMKTSPFFWSLRFSMESTVSPTRLGDSLPGRGSDSRTFSSAMAELPLKPHSCG